jgi:predicted RNA-binding protein associated with RNAse of E/G family
MTEPHSPKVEIFDIADGTNTDPKGVVRLVDDYREEPFGLYLARPTPGRVQFWYLQSWLLPDLGLRVTQFSFNPEHQRDQDFYADVVRITRNGSRWVTTDLYLDLVLKDGISARVIDTDELVAAVAGGLLSPKDAEYALETTYTAIEGLAIHGYDLAAWLSTRNIALTWKPRDAISPRRE